MSIPQTVRAARYHQYGVPEEVVAIEQVELAAPEGDEVLVRVIAAPINPSDLNTLEGKYGKLRELPDIPGNEGLAVVEAIGRNVEDMAPGNMVLVSSSSWREWGVWPRAALNRIPTGLDHWQAAMLRINPATAWAMLAEAGKLEAGDYVVQNAGTSAVSRSVQSLAVRRKLKLITLVRRSDSVGELKTAGFEHVFEDSDAGLEGAKALIGKAGARLALNAVGGESASRLFKLLGEDGGMFTYGGMSRQPVKLSTGPLIFGERWMRGFWLTRWLERQPRERVRKMYRELAELSLNEDLLLPVSSVYTLDEVSDAVRDAGRSGRSGKVLLRMTID